MRLFDWGFDFKSIHCKSASKGFFFFDVVLKKYGGVCDVSVTQQRSDVLKVARKVSSFGISRITIHEQAGREQEERRK
jgi:hypothetical protein